MPWAKLVIHEQLMTHVMTYVMTHVMTCLVTHLPFHMPKVLWSELFGVASGQSRCNLKFREK